MKHSLGEISQRFPALSRLEGIAHCFVTRVPGIEVSHDKAEALRRLDAIHAEVRAACGMGAMSFMTAQQVHGDGVALIEGLGATTDVAASLCRGATRDARIALSTATERRGYTTEGASQAGRPDECFPDCDGMVTDQIGVVLGIYVADCCAVYLVDPIRKAIGLVHSGKKGTELGIVGKAMDVMQAKFGCAPEDLIVQLSPCIRPPHYEIDFAAEIVRSCRERGVRGVHDDGSCTACDLTRYYSYRAEKGKTGRMLALLALTAQ